MAVKTNNTPQSVAVANGACLRWEVGPEGGLRPVLYNGKKVSYPSWAPQEGSQEAFLACPVFEVLYEGTRGPGKGLPLNEPVWTPLGAIPISNVKLGTVVCCPDGSRSKVIGVFPQGVRPTYEIEFDDGAIARCDDQHIWAIHVQSEPTKRANWEYRLMVMPEVLRQYEAGKRLHIPTLDRLSTQDSPRLKEWPVEPYLLGLLLGDGSLGKVTRYCTVDEELLEVMENAGATKWKTTGNGLMNFGFPVASKVHEGIRKLRLQGTLSHTKFVPKMYLGASPETRLAVLQGLMDTDGTADKSGYVTFSSASEQLALDVQHLARSLGARASLKSRPTMLHGEEKRDAFFVYIQPAGKFEPFRLERKQERIRGYQHGVLRRRIVRITALEPQETVCIKIDHPQGLFVTRDFVVTHNTDALLWDFGQEVGKGWGADWRGIIFRQTYKELADLIAKTQNWFPKVFPGCKFNSQECCWKFKTGEVLLLRQMRVPGDYNHYHGHAYPFIAFEELTTWADSICYLLMMSCCRSTRVGMPRKFRATTNPYGPGHNWVKRRFRLPHFRGKVIRDSMKDGKVEPPRVAIYGHLTENKILLHADPEYPQRIRAAARNPSELAAWVDGSWDVTSGGMFDDIWDGSKHVIPAFDLRQLPRGWKIDRSFDWGSSKPFSVGWWAESNGEPLKLGNRTIGRVRGDLIRIGEWYGWNGNRNEGVKMLASKIAEGILDREEEMGILGRVKPGPADDSIFDVENGVCIATDMQNAGVTWAKAGKTPGSRKNGWQALRTLLSGSMPGQNGSLRENPGFFVLDSCDQFQETVPSLPRDAKDPDDVDTAAEDHIADEVRYRCMHQGNYVKQRSF